METAAESMFDWANKDPWDALGKFNQVMDGVAPRILSNIYQTLLIIGIAVAIIVLAWDGFMYILRSNTRMPLQMVKERIITHVVLIFMLTFAAEIVAAIVNFARTLM